MRHENVSATRYAFQCHSTYPSQGFPVSALLIGTIYTSTKALQYLSIPVYTIFKNLTIILIAYGEVLWFGGSVTGMALFSFGLMVLSSVIAAWGDIQHALSKHGYTEEASAQISTLNAGYMWMMVNCLCSAAYVLGMRKRIKLTNFKDFDSEVSSIIWKMMANRLLQRCFITMSSPSLSLSWHPCLSRTGLRRTSTRISRQIAATILSSPCSSLAYLLSSSPTPRHGAYA